MNFTNEQIEFLLRCKSRFYKTDDKQELSNQLMCFVEALREIFSDNIFATRLSDLLNPLLFNSSINKPKKLDIMDNAVRYYQETIFMKNKGD
jgi:hypothetical protein